ncbi:MAG: rhomboid family intramembrane serine protease [Blautia sp.]|nr:rhomboid family intramembrane serine protease [Blautia sp.]
MKKKLPKVTFNSPLILGFSMICLIAVIANFITGGAANSVLFSTYRSSLASFFTWLRFFTHVFGHVSWAHLVGNMSYILLLGPGLEEKYGSRKLVLVMAVCAFVTGVINSLFFGNTALCGASGIAFAFILLTSFTSFKEGEIPLTFILVAVIYLGQQIFDGIMIDDNVSNLSHIVGGIVGGTAGYMFNRRKAF